MRVIAGPNGSGKSTVMGELDPSWIGVFVNADDLEVQLRTGTVDLEERYGLADADGCLIERLCDSMRNSGLARKADLHAVVDSIAVTSAGQRVTIDPASVNAYVAAAISDFVRRELLRAGETFTFETVMSSPDKVEFMREARDAGYRTYLYFIATEDPSINVARVQLRVAQGGHDVPEEHIRQRYRRSLDLMAAACEQSNRAYIFDNSGEQHRLVAEITEGEELRLPEPQLPIWFANSPLYRQFRPDA